MGPRTRTTSPRSGDSGKAIPTRRRVVEPVGDRPPSEDPSALPLSQALGRVEAYIRRYVVLPADDAYVALTLWVAHTHAMEFAEATPYLAVMSPEKQSGKTRLLEVLEPLVNACTGILIAPTSSTILRSLDAIDGATLLLDELDAVFRDRSDRYEETRGVINAGHRRGATVPRNMPGPKNTWMVRYFPVFGPKALAGIGKLPDTIADRSIPIRMVRRKRSEPVEKYRARTARPAARALASALRASLDGGARRRCLPAVGMGPRLLRWRWARDSRMTSAWRSRITGQGTQDPTALVANPRNWRTHPRHQRDALAGILGEVGWVHQVVVNRSTGHLVDGHLRVELAADQHEAEIPVLYVELSEQEETLILASLDPMGALAGVDRERLASLLDGVEPESADVRKLLADLARDAGLDAVTDGLTDEDEPARETDVYVREGETWQLGDHRLVIGDATASDVVRSLVGDDEVDIIWTDPPYGVSYEGAAGTIENDDLPEAGLRDLLERSLGNAKDVLRPGGSVYVCAPGGRQGWVFVDVMTRLGLYRQTITWVKDVLVMGRSDYHWRHELLHLGVKAGEGTRASSPLLYGWRPGAAHWFVPDRTLDTVWEIARPRSSPDHPTQKPVELVRRSLSCSSRRGDSVLDPFAGSGSTMIAAETIGRRCLGVELDPRYAQAAIERWSAFTGQEAQRG